MALPLWRPVAADPSRYFSPDEVRKAKDYQRPKQRGKLVRYAVMTVVLVVIVWSGFAPDLLDRADPGAWPLELLVVLAVTMLLVGLPTLPIDVWEEFVHEVRWGFSTQTAGRFAVDQVKQFLIFGVVLNGAIVIPLWAFIRWTELWWLWGAIAVTGVILFFSVVYPVAILPAFNKFTPLEDAALVERLRALAERAGVRIGSFRVMDASTRSRKDNAFFAGMGATRRVVLYDNMLEMPHECVEVVVAHELGHWRRRHTALGVVATLIQLPAMLVVVWAVTSADSVLRWAEVSELGDPAALPLFLLVGAGAQALLSRAGAWMRRWFERQADQDALDLTRAPEAFADTWRRMVDRNLPDVAPSWWTRSGMSHPPVAERMAHGEAWAARGS